MGRADYLNTDAGRSSKSGLSYENILLLGVSIAVLIDSWDVWLLRITFAIVVIVYALEVIFNAVTALSPQVNEQLLHTRLGAELDRDRPWLRLLFAIAITAGAVIALQDDFRTFFWWAVLMVGVLGIAGAVRSLNTKGRNPDC